MKYYYLEDYFGSNHYYRFDGSGNGIHVNKSSLCINEISYVNGLNEETTEEEFNKALEEVMGKLGIISCIKQFKFV